MKVLFKKMRPNAIIPSFGHDDPSNAGLDLYCVIDPKEWDALDLHDDDGLIINPGCDAWIPTGVSCEITDLSITIPVDDRGMLSRSVPFTGWKPAILIRPRSSMAKEGLEITEGTVDAGYRGELKIHVRNVGKSVQLIRTGQRIAQAVPVLLPEIEVCEVSELSDTERGAKGFGSSGR